MDKKLVTCGLFLDFSKAFDTINMILCYRNSVDMVFMEILSNGLKTTYTIVIGSSKLVTLYLAVRPWLPQGSTLGPLLFLLYINDLPNCSSKLSFRIFADDTNMFYTISNLHNLESVMNEEFKSVVKCCAIYKLSKTNYILVSSSRLSGSINVKNIKIKSQIKYLGVYIDKHLHWGPQIKHINNKLAKNIGIIT